VSFRRVRPASDSPIRRAKKVSRRSVLPWRRHPRRRGCPSAGRPLRLHGPSRPRSPRQRLSRNHALQEVSDILDPVVVEGVGFLWPAEQVSAHLQFQQVDGGLRAEVSDRASPHYASSYSHPSPAANRQGRRLGPSRLEGLPSQANGHLFLRRLKFWQGFHFRKCPSTRLRAKSRRHVRPGCRG
jgi:hypothetical protein